jgi:hypothetical protein
MNQSTMYALKFARRIYSEAERILSPNKASGLPLDCFDQAASDLIKRKIIDNQPCMICRFGSNEIDATTRYLNIPKASKRPIQKNIDYILGKSGAFWWDESIKTRMQMVAGFFPTTEKSLEAFGRRMIKDIENIDVLGSWVKREEEILEFMKGALIVGLKDLEPYYHDDPWSEALEGKTVLVIHPFEQSIQQQYKKRRFLFKDERTLPEFELKTLKSIQSIGGNNCGFDTWFDALDWMCEKISDIKFDIAIIGAGAYGLPLASYVKNLGKKSIHLGGATQVLFGIKGKRWDDRPFFQGLYNQHWVRPLPSEVPHNYQSIEAVEGGCFW